MLKIHSITWLNEKQIFSNKNSDTRFNVFILRTMITAIPLEDSSACRDNTINYHSWRNSRAWSIVRRFTAWSAGTGRLAFVGSVLNYCCVNWVSSHIIHYYITHTFLTNKSITIVGNQQKLILYNCLYTFVKN